MSRDICTVDHCSRPAISSTGLCDAHRARMRIWGDCRPDIPIRQRDCDAPKRCTVMVRGKPCGKPSHRQGICLQHLTRHKKYGQYYGDMPIGSAEFKRFGQSQRTDRNTKKGKKNE